MDDYLGTPPKRRRLSLLHGGLPLSFGSQVITEDIRKHGLATRGGHKERIGEEDANITISSTSKLAGQTVAPFLAKHIPDQYAPLGVPGNSNGATVKDSNTKYCYRHRPDLKCRRQANEPSMDQLQHVKVIFLGTLRCSLHIE